MNAVIIPAYEPDSALTALTEKLSAIPELEIIVVNDGSAKEYDEIFSSLDTDRVVVLTHPENKGKGAAMKTAYGYISDKMPQVEYVVAADADGQHSPQDVMRLLEFAAKHKDCLSLGVRKFSSDIPVRSRLGNKITRVVFRIASGAWVSDTQTGLRAFSTEMIPFMLGIPGDRYEYEMNVLMSCARGKIPFAELPIETIYHDKQNSCSHFSTVKDSLRIYRNIFKFAGASFISFLFDYIIFFPLSALFGCFFSYSQSIVFGNIAARLFSAALNYFLNSHFVFHSNENRAKSLFQYALLATGILLLNTGVLYVFSSLLHIPKPVAKALTELILFIISFTVQKLIIFKKAEDAQKK